MTKKDQSAFGFSRQERLEYEQSLLRLRFASLLESFMEESGIQAKELASRMGRGKAWLSKLLSGRHNPTVDTLAQMAFALGLRWDVSLTSVDRAGTPAERDGPPPDWTRPRQQAAPSTGNLMVSFAATYPVATTHIYESWPAGTSGFFEIASPGPTSEAVEFHFWQAGVKLPIANLIETKMVEK